MSDTAILHPEVHQDINVLAPTALESMTRGEIDMQIATAKRYPRSLKKVLADAITLATLNEDTAESCWYSLSRSSGGNGSKAIEGPSIRLAEMMASAWTNLRIGSMITDIGPTMVTARGMVHDLETNVAYFADVQRRITNKNKQRFSDDMIIVTANAAAAIATRNAIIKAVPRAYVDQVLAEAKKVAMGGSRPLEVRRQMAVDYFLKAGISQDRIFKAVEVRGMEEIGIPQLEILTGLKNQLKEGNAVDDVFPNGQNATDRIRETFLTPQQGQAAAEAQKPSEQPQAEQPKEETAAKVFPESFRTSAEAVTAFMEAGIATSHLIAKLDGILPAQWQPGHLATLYDIYRDIKLNGIPATDFFDSL